VEKQRPTEIGDVLILRTSLSFTVHAVGPVVAAGQHDFSKSEQVRHVAIHAEAVTTAKSIVAPGRRIYLLDIDTAEWSQISDEGESSRYLFFAHARGSPGGRPDI